MTLKRKSYFVLNFDQRWQSTVCYVVELHDAFLEKPKHVAKKNINSVRSVMYVSVPQRDFISKGFIPLYISLFYTT
jgi:hypothetical protein